MQNANTLLEICKKVDFAIGNTDDFDTYPNLSGTSQQNTQLRSFNPPCIELLSIAGVPDRSRASVRVCSLEARRRASTCTNRTNPLLDWRADR